MPRRSDAGLSGMDRGCAYAPWYTRNNSLDDKDRLCRPLHNRITFGLPGEDEIMVPVIEEEVVIEKRPVALRRRPKLSRRT